MAEPALKKETEAANGATEQHASQKSIVREYAEALIIAFFLAIFIRTFIIQAYKIPSGSDEPTLLVGDHILVDKLIYGLRMPESAFGLEIPGITTGRFLFHIEPVHRQDMIVLVFPPDRTKDFIKRVVAIGGDTVQVKNGRVWVNGKAIDDPHAHLEVSDLERLPSNPRDNYGPVTVPPGKLFVMGDNRDRSYDSRFWGYVDENDVEGRAMVVYWSWDSDSNSLVPIRWNRFGMLIH